MRWLVQRIKDQPRLELLRWKGTQCISLKHSPAFSEQTWIKVPAKDSKACAHHLQTSNPKADTHRRFNPNDQK